MEIQFKMIYKNIKDSYMGNWKIDLDYILMLILKIIQL